jgi:hypothetical protein
MEGGFLGLLLGSKVNGQGHCYYKYICLLRFRFRTITLVSLELRYSNFIHRLLMEGGFLGLLLGSKVNDQGHCYYT